MKKIIPLIIVILFVLCGCSSKGTHLTDNADADLDIPKVDYSAADLGRNIKNTIGATSLSGPSDNIGEIMRSVFFVRNLENLDFYLNMSYNTYYATENDNIVIYGQNFMSDYTISDIMYLKNINMDPTAYYVSRNPNNTVHYVSFMWEIENGYLSVIAIPISNMSYKDLPVYNIAYASDIKYFSYVNHDHINIYDYSIINNNESSTPDDSLTADFEVTSGINQDNTKSNNEYAIKKAREFFASGVGEYPDAIPGGGYIEVCEETPEEWNNYAQYSIVGRGFSPIYDSDCFEFSLETSTFYFSSYGTFYKIVCDDNGIHIYYGDSKDACNELCGQVIMERYEDYN